MANQAVLNETDIYEGRTGYVDRMDRIYRRMIAFL